MEINVSQSLFGRDVYGERSTNISDDIWQISDEVKRTFMTISMAIIGTPVSVFGICSNVINILVFIRQGFKESINRTLLALAVADLGSLITLLWKCICHNPLFLNAGTPLLPEDMQFLTGSLPHVIFVRISGWLTALLTSERCVSVLFPLKVKSIFTPTRNKIIIAVIYILNFATASPFYIAIKLAWKFVSATNTSMFGLVYMENSDRLLNIGYLLIGPPCSLPFTFIVITSTIILVISLKRQSKWRQQTAVSEKSTVTKEKAVIKMVIAIAMVLIVCLLIPSFVNIPLQFIPEFHISGKYRNLFLTTVSVLVAMEGINSAANIFVYYNMSTKYRQTFQEIFLQRKKGSAHVSSSVLSTK